MKTEREKRLIHFEIHHQSCHISDIPQTGDTPEVYPTPVRVRYSSTSKGMVNMSCSSVVVVLLSSIALMLLIAAAGTEAKRGCVNFGHSCYGGMGKRASDVIDSNEEILQDIQDEENPAFVFTGPRSSFKPKSYQRLTQQQYDNISRVIRQWIQNYRRAQEISNDAN